MNKTEGVYNLKWRIKNEEPENKEDIIDTDAKHPKSYFDSSLINKSVVYTFSIAYVQHSFHNFSIPHTEPNFPPPKTA